MAKLARCGKSKHGTNACRNIHRLLKKSQRMLPVEVTYVQTMMRRARKRPMTCVHYPVLNLSQWARYIFSTGGHFFLQGKDLTNMGAVQDNLQTFWERWKQTEPEFPFLQDFPDPRAWRSAIPLAVHGDEGRGRLKRPVMIVGLQSILPLLEFGTNLKGLLDVDIAFTAFKMLALTIAHGKSILNRNGFLAKAFYVHSASLWYPTIALYQREFQRLTLRADQ